MFWRTPTQCHRAVVGLLALMAAASRGQEPGRQEKPAGDPLPVLLKRQGYTEVPLVLRNNWLCVKAQINGHPANLLVDTGADHTYLDPARTRDYGLEWTPTEKMVVSPPFGRASASRTSQAEVDLHLGGLRLERHAVHSSDLASLNATLKQQGVEEADGLLGSGTLEAYAAVIDCKEKKLYLLPPEAQAGERPGPALLQQRGYCEVPFRLKAHFLFVTGYLYGREVNLNVDTGADTSFDRARTGRHGLQWVWSTPEQRWYCEVDLLLGACRVKKFYAWADNLSGFNAVAKRIQAEEVDGDLGLKTLRDCSAVIDYKAKKMYLKRE